MLNIPSTNSSPRIIFQEETGIMIIEGESYPENSFDFFEPIFKWFQTEYPKYTTFELQVKLKYMNSSSTKCMLDILEILNDSFLKEKDTRIKWFYEADNNRSLDLAEEFKEDLVIPFEIIPISN